MMVIPMLVVAVMRTVVQAEVGAQPVAMARSAQN